MKNNVSSQTVYYGSEIAPSLDLKIETTIEGMPRTLNKEEVQFIREKHNEILTMLRKTNLLEHKKFLSYLDQQKFDLLALFGDNKIFVKEIPNGYEKDSLNPWFSVTTNRGEFIIGARKRVIQISWDNSNISIRAANLFPDEDVTKEGKMIHAWDYVKAKEYIDKLLNFE